MRLKLRPLGVLGILFLLFLGFSPSIAWLVYQQVHIRFSPNSMDLGNFRFEGVPEATQKQVEQYSQYALVYQQALAALKLSTTKQLKLMAQAYQVYLQAQQVLGAAKANAMMKLLILETQNQNLSLQHLSMFSNPETALVNVQQWLSLMAQSRKLSGEPLDRLMLSQSPTRMFINGVRKNRKAIMVAANTLRLSPAVLASIVDTEQGGNQAGYGLSGMLRRFTDIIALRNAEGYGSSGFSGRFSQTVGLLQMSWRDAILQKERMQVFKVHVPYPNTEAQAREILQNPQMNLLFTASRLRGYLAFASQKNPLNSEPFVDAWYYFLAPAWHNNPYKAKAGFTWAYAWNGFFKACWYEQMLSRGNF